MASDELDLTFEESGESRGSFLATALLDYYLSYVENTDDAKKGRAWAVCVAAASAAHPDKIPDLAKQIADFVEKGGPAITRVK